MVISRFQNFKISKFLISAKASNDLLRRMLISAKASNDRQSRARFNISRFMEILFYDDGSSITGMLNREHGYAIERKKKGGKVGYYAVRKVPYLRDWNTDKRHAAFLLTMARMAVNARNRMVKDIRITVRELIDAHVSLVTGFPLARIAYYEQKDIVRTYCNIISMRLKKVKPNSVLNAREINNLKSLLGE